MAKLQTSTKEYLLTAIAVAFIVALFFYDGGSYLVVGVIPGVAVLSFWLGAGSSAGRRRTSSTSSNCGRFPTRLRAARFG